MGAAMVEAMVVVIVAADVKDTIRTGFDEVRNDIAEVREVM